MRHIGVGSLVLSPSDKRAVLSVLDSNQLSPGPKVKEFEKEFASSHNARHGLFVNSGTDALRIALATLKEVHRWKDGDKVIIPALTFVATCNVVLQLNLKPVFVDVSLDDFNIDRERLWHACKDNDLVGMIPVHLFGKPCEMKGEMYPFSIMATAREHGLKVIEDSCETMGVSKLAGDIACYSTYVCHLISTGVGGLAITNRREYADVMRSLANHGRSFTGIPGFRSNDIKSRFKFERIGYSSRATEFEAALGLEQLKRLPEMLKQRRRIAEILNKELSEFMQDLMLPTFHPTTPHAYMMYPIVVRNCSRVNKWTLCKFLEKNRIETREMLPLINQPCYKSLKINEDDFPVASGINKRGFYIGCHPEMSEDDVYHIVDVFRRFLLTK